MPSHLADMGFTYFKASPLTYCPYRRLVRFEDTGWVSYSVFYALSDIAENEINSVLGHDSALGRLYLTGDNVG